MNAEYRAFLEAKVPAAPSQGMAIDPADINPILKPHQRAMVQWGVSGGRRAYCASCGLGKTVVQLETLRIILAQVGGRGLGVELNPDYFNDAAFYCAAAEREMSIPTLFDLLAESEAA